MKQPGMLFGCFGGLYLAWISITGKTAYRQVLARLGLYSLGCLLPFLTICIWLKIASVFPQFWFWTISSTHASTQPSIHSILVLRTRGSRSRRSSMQRPCSG